MAAKLTRKGALLTRGGEAPTRRSSNELRTRPSTASLDLVLNQARVGVSVASKATPCKPPPYSTKPPPTSSSAASATPEVETGLFKYTAYVRDRALATPSPAAPVKRKNDHAGGSVSKRLR
ncbi:hypothetical protein DOTSEDRAFT_75420 [Dothistroma septosporum NZE10]|uniref:Uncharacterized protein n=1 Tax=Dothistroma septosporum (strain NZE10 / CBS 128990) TaxID=675120 RepID=M2WI21_DOTSN|nr:hypothetical protein DOTSEDRAFT_75420 [Dothistroma septosporum NZE10]